MKTNTTSFSKQLILMISGALNIYKYIYHISEYIYLGFLCIHITSHTNKFQDPSHLLSLSVVKAPELYAMNSNPGLVTY